MEREDLIQKLATSDLSDNDFGQILEFADSIADAGFDINKWRAAELAKLDGKNNNSGQSPVRK